MKSVVEEIAYRIGVGIDARTRINTGPDYMVPYPIGKTMSQVLDYIGACHGGNWIITEENLLRLVPLTTAPDETFHIIDEDYEKIKTSDGHLLIYKEQQVFNAILPAPSGEPPNSVIPRTYYITDEYGNRVITPEGYFLVWDTETNSARAEVIEGLINIPVVCGQITKGSALTISRVTMTGEGGETYTAGDDSGAALEIEGNPYATQGICDDLYAAYNGLVYFPYTATKALYDPATELGDQVKIGDMVHSVMYGAKLTLDHNFRADIEAPNSEELSAEYPYLSAIGSLKQTTEELNNAISQAASDLEGKVSDVDLQAEIDRAKGVELSLNNSIGTETARATEAENALNDRIASIEDLSPGALPQHIQALETTVSKHATAIGSLSETVDNQAEALTDITGKMHANEDAIEKLQTTSGQHNEAIQQAQSDVSGLQSKVTAIENALIDIYSWLNALEAGNGETE